MSQEYVGAFIIILVTLLPQFGIQIETAELTAMVQAIITVITGAYIMYRRFKQGDITIAGFRKG